MPRASGAMSKSGPSAYVRQFLDMMQKPDVDHIEGLSPAISIEQKTTSRRAALDGRTVTEIYDYTAPLWARVGIPYSPATGFPLRARRSARWWIACWHGPQHVALPAGADRPRAEGRIPQGIRRAAEEGLPAAEDRRQVLRDRRVDLDKKYKHDIDVVVDRIVVRPIAAPYYRDRARADRRRHRHRRVRRTRQTAKRGWWILLGEVRLAQFGSPLRRLSRMRNGLGTELFFEPELVVPATESLSLARGAIGAVGAHLRQLALLPADAGIRSPAPIA